MFSIIINHRSSHTTYQEDGVEENENAFDAAKLAHGEGLTQDIPNIVPFQNKNVNRQKAEPTAPQNIVQTLRCECVM